MASAIGLPIASVRPTMTIGTLCVAMLANRYRVVGARCCFHAVTKAGRVACLKSIARMVVIYLPDTGSVETLVAFALRLLFAKLKRPPLKRNPFEAQLAQNIPKREVLVRSRVAVTIIKSDPMIMSSMQTFQSSPGFDDKGLRG